MEIITTYINDFLTPRLKLYSLSSETVNLIASDIEKRLAALIARWNDLTFRRTLLITGVEEAAFYQPDGDLETKALVVLTVRNSLLEDIASTSKAARKYGLMEKAIPDNDIRQFTGEAVTYFQTVNLTKLSLNLTPSADDPYQALPGRYPVAWNALRILGSLTKQYQVFDPIIQPKIDFAMTHAPIKNWKPENLEILSGMDPDFTYELEDTLVHVCKNELDVFFIDSFKILTRHPEKLFKVLEIVLRANVKVVTFNYLISNGYVCRRQELLRPAHSEKDIARKLDNLEGLTKAHFEGLKVIRKLWG